MTVSSELITFIIGGTAGGILLALLILILGKGKALIIFISIMLSGWIYFAGGEIPNSDLTIMDIMMQLLDNLL